MHIGWRRMSAKGHLDAVLGAGVGLHVKVSAATFFQSAHFEVSDVGFITI